MKIFAVIVALCAMLCFCGCVAPKAVEITPHLDATMPLASGNTFASPTVGSGNTATVPVAVATATSQPVNQQATQGGGTQTAGHDQRIELDNRPINVQVPGGELVALAVVIGVVVFGIVGLVKHHGAAVRNRRMHEAADRHIGELLRTFTLVHCLKKGIP